MRYRAILVTTEQLPRPIQSFFNDLEEAKKWSKAILSGRLKTDKVQIWQTQESLAANVWADEVKVDKEQLKL